MDQSPKRIWEEVKGSLSSHIPQHLVELWIEPLVPLAISSEEVMLGCPNRFTLNWVRQNHLKDITRAFHEALNRTPRVTLRVYVSKKPSNSNHRDDLRQMDLIAPEPAKGPVFNRHMTFESFVVGDGNRFAYASTQALARGLLPSNSLLLLVGSPGMGKSHLSCAVGNHIMAEDPSTRVCYLTAEEFTGEVVKGVRSNKMERLKEKFRRKCDVLLLEDMQFFIGKMKIQEEVLYTLDALLGRGKRVLLTSVRPPSDIEALDGLRSRLGSGLMVEILPPDLNTRAGIIKNKAEREGVSLKDDVATLLAENLTGDIRQLESCVINLAVKSSLLGIPVTFGLAEEVLTSVGGIKPPVNIKGIQKIVGKEFKVSVSELASKSRKKNLAYPRKLSMYLCRKYTDRPLKEIGRAFNRAHATVVAAVESIERLRKTEADIDRDLARLKQVIENGRK